MNNIIYQKAYLKLLLQEALNNIQPSYLPQPFSNILLNLKTAMFKAIDAVKQQYIAINTEVNFWKQELIQAWKNLSNILSPEQKQYLNNTILDLTTKYIQYMHGINTGY